MSSETEIVSGVTEEIAPSQDQSAEMSSQSEKGVPHTDVAKSNFRELERRRDEAERRARELEARLYEIENAKNQQPDEFDSMDDDAIVEAKQIKKLRKEIQELKSQKNAGLSAEDVARIRLKDYDEVVSEENVKAHLLSNPTLAQMVKSSANPYEAAYHLLKKLHTPKSEVKPDLSKKLEEATTKPRSLNEAVAKVPSSASGQGNSIGEIEARRQEALKRAQRYLGGYY